MPNIVKILFKIRRKIIRLLVDLLKFHDNQLEDLLKVFYFNK